MLRWDNIGKVAADHNVSRTAPGGGLVDNNGPLVNGFFGKSRQALLPPPLIFSYKRNLWCAGNSRFEWKPPHELLETASDEPFAVASPWVICGGRVSATFAGQSRTSSNGASQCSIELSVDPSKWDQVWSGSCDSGAHVDAEFDDLLQSHQMPNQGVYNYSLRFTVSSGDAIKVESLAIVTDVMAHPLSLPRLNLGSNVFKYLLRTIYMEYVYVEFVCKYLCVFYIYIVRSRYTDDSSTRDILIEHRCFSPPFVSQPSQREDFVFG